MNLYLSTPHSLGSNWMKLYLAGTYSRPYVVQENLERLLILESFFYIQDWMLPFIRNHWDFLLDSGAFTFMQNTKGSLNWDKYVEKYAKFVIDMNIELFFELDIDSIIGLKEVERLRDKLQTLTNRKCIPVWHKSRGKEYWIKMAKEYDYIAIGGIVSKEISKTEYPFFNPMINLAKDQGAKVHGLGFTALQDLSKYKFYSVDSTAWVYGNRSGFLQKFDGRTLIKYEKPLGTKIKAKETAIHNFNEWLKFQKYAKEYL